MKLSARNQLAGTIVEITEGATNGIVKIEIAPGLIVSSSITNAAIEELGLQVGKPATAITRHPTSWLVLRTNPLPFAPECSRHRATRKKQSSIPVWFVMTVPGSSALKLVTEAPSL